MSRKHLAAIIFFCMSAFMAPAQPNPSNYDETWKRIDSLINKKGLAKSALEEVNTLYLRAKKEGNDAQLIKALLYRMNLEEKLQENSVQKDISQLEQETVGLAEPAKSILESIEGELIWNYFQQHRWSLYDRTETSDLRKQDITTWGISDFHKKIGRLFLASINAEKLLQQTKIEPFDAIIIRGNARRLRPTLFDLLAHRALDYLKSNERYITVPAYTFEINNAEAFSDVETFVNYHFATNDSLSLQFKALQLFQRLLKFHHQDDRPDALIDVDIERIGFVNNNAVLESKDELYRVALEQLISKYKDQPSAAQASYLLARIYTDKAGRYDPLIDSANRYAIVTARTICEKIILQKDSSEGKSNCRYLLEQILRKDLQLQTEKVNLPDQPFRALVTYRNFTQLHFRLIKLNHMLKMSLGNNSWQNAYWKNLLQLPALKTFSQPLPETVDYQSHKVEIRIDALPVGEYALLSSVNDSARMDNDPLAVQFFYVSNIAYINIGSDYFVLNRETGLPLARVNVQAWYRYYDNKQNKWLERQGENLFTDKNGYFRISPPKANHNDILQLELTLGNDHLFLDDESAYALSNSNMEEGEKQSDKMKYEADHLKTFFFTDRSIYRPGQIVYFKGICMTKDFDTRQYKIVPQFKTRVILYDANNMELDSLEISSNDFGSYNGKFHLAENLLNGEFRIEDDSTLNDWSFSVEEYKRPKFYVDYEKLKGSFMINDSIRITGFAKAYAGNTIENAKVSFRVLREPGFPYPWLYWRRGMPRISETEIAHGSVITARDGKFSIHFKAIPDPAVNKELDPIFNYKIMADITDINGETRSAETAVCVGYKSLILSINLQNGENLPADSLSNLSIKTNTLSGEFESTEVNITIYKLRSPDRLIRQRYWQEPDQFVMGREEYLKYFPNDEYSSETREESWEKILKAFEATEATKEDGRFGLLNAKFEKGWYLIEARAKDKNGLEIKDIKYVQLYDGKTGDPASPQYNWTFDQSGITLPGNKAILNIGSSAKNLFVIQLVEKKNAGPALFSDGQRPSLTYSFFSLSNEKKAFDFPVTESDRGGFGVLYTFIKDNRMYTGSHIVSVPWTNKDLMISYESFRDKTQPGNEEKWKVKISGYKTEKVAAEMLATMYDVSLDHFRFQEWRKPDIWENYFRKNNWNGKNCFRLVQSQEKYREESRFDFLNKIYDVINIKINGGYNGVSKHMKMPEPNMQPEPGEAAQLLPFGAVAPQEMNVLFKNKERKQQLVVRDFVLEDIGGENKGTGPDHTAVQIRKNFSETAFFFPDLRTDSSGNLEFSFTMPESLTRWKWMSLAHTQNLSFGYGEKYITTQKQLMLQPGMPRFLREGDKVILPAKIVNLSDSELTGEIELELIDPTTNQSADGSFQNMQANQYFTVAAGQSTVAGFPVSVPDRYDRPLTYRVTARAIKKGGKALPHDTGFSDGEEATLPVLGNRLLVTETLPLNIKGSETKNFKMEKLLKSGESETLDQHAMVVEFSSNPAWYAVQALPYLVDYPFECAEQIFNRFYANALASKIAHSSPRIREITARWKNPEDSTLLSSLQKNEELKSVLLQETPWVLQAKDETGQRKNIALLFDGIRINRDLASSLSQLQQMQRPDGEFAWFTGGPDDRYITQYILTGIGHLKKLDAIPASLAEKIQSMVKAALPYLDNMIGEDDEAAMRQNQKPSLGPVQVQYLYMRSFFNEYAIPGEDFKAVNDYRKLSQQYWLQQDTYLQGMIALSLYRTGDLQKAKDILASLKQNAIVNEEMGMYWKTANVGYYWWQAPVEAEALMIEAFGEITNDQKSVAGMKTWLLKKKQTENWKTTKATADACYALLLQGADWLAGEPEIRIELGGKIIRSEDQKQEAGTGYFKKVFNGPEVGPAMGNITVSIPSPAPGQESRMCWGSVYWQYFEELDKISPAVSPLRLAKKLFVEKNTDRGPVLEPLNDHNTLKTGDRIKVRIELRADRDLEYLQMKDMRASCMEPVNVLSAYKWQGGLGYYETVKDASTNFFFDRLPKGAYVFEYPLLVSQAGSFSNGLTTIQCMYAPEFSAHSEGIRVNVEGP